MEEINVWGFCDNDCKRPVYSKEQVLALLQQAIESGSLENIDPNFAAIAKVMDGHGGDPITFWTGTEAEFNALDPKPVVVQFIPRRGSDGKIYICLDDSAISELPVRELTPEEVRAICT